MAYNIIGYFAFPMRNKLKRNSMNNSSDYHVSCFGNVIHVVDNPLDFSFQTRGLQIQIVLDIFRMSLSCCKLLSSPVHI